MFVGANPKQVVGFLTLANQEGADMERRKSNRSLASSQVCDEQILSEVKRALQVPGHVGTLRKIRVEILEGCVVLSGRLPSYYLKQIAQTAAMKVGGVLQLENEIQVG